MADVVIVFLAFAVTEYDLDVVMRGIGTNGFVGNAQRGSGIFKQSCDISVEVGEMIGRFKAVVGLNAFIFHSFSWESF